MSQDTPLVFEGYGEFLADIQGRIRAAQVQAALSLSREVAWLYWQIGHEILSRQARHGWGAKVVDRLAADLKAAFPGVEGFSPRNLKYMRAFAEAYPDAEIVQQLLHNSPPPTLLRPSRCRLDGSSSPRDQRAPAEEEERMG